MPAPRDPIAAATPVVVVGCDGSTAGRPALVWAAEEALRRHARLRVVSAWQSPVLAYSELAISGINVGDLDGELEASTGSLQRSAVAAAHIDGKAAELVVRSGRPAQVLMDHSRDAELLVVGAHGQGLLRRMLLGSTSIDVLHHSAVPVVIVPCAATPESHR